MDVMKSFFDSARANPRTVVYPEGSDERVMSAAFQVAETGIAHPILVGNVDKIQATAAQLKLSLEALQIIDPAADQEILTDYINQYAQFRDVKPAVAGRLLKKPLFYAGMMVRNGRADAMVTGAATATAMVIQGATLTIGLRQGITTPSSFFIMNTKGLDGEHDTNYIFADCAINIAPTAEQLASIGVATAYSAHALLKIEPRVAFLSFATKGSAQHADVDKVRDAVRMAKEIAPDMHIDGELQGDSAIVPHVAERKVKQSDVAGKANVLIFPDLDAGNIAYKLVQYLGQARAYGPILQGFAKPVNDLSRGASVDDIVSVTAISVVQADEKQELK